MKFRYNFEAVEMPDEIILVPVGEKSLSFHGVIKLNKSGKEIADMMQNDISEEEIVEKLAKEYNNDRKELALYVHKILDTFRNIGVIDE